MIGLIAIGAAAASSAAVRCATHVDGYQPPRGIISSPSMAAQVAEIYLHGVYSKATMDYELPLKVKLEAGVWHVTGNDLPVPTIGGVAEIDLCQSTGQVLHVLHRK